MRHMLWTALLILSAAATGTAAAGQPAPAADDPAADMTIEELRAFQSYFYSSGGRDPLTMRLPTDSELGLIRREGPRKASTPEEREQMLSAWIGKLEDELKTRDYDAALATALEATGVIDNEWPPVKPENTKLNEMSERIRDYSRLALRLKAREEVAAEFKALDLRIEGVSWSPSDAKAMVNGRMLSAGEVLLDTRKEGDLRVEMIEERSVVFQYKGNRFRLPVEIFSRLGAPEEDT